MKKISIVTCACLMWGAPVGADVIVDWNVHTAQAIATAAGARPGPSGLLDYAMVHLAMHDAIQAFQKRFEPYCGAIANASGSPIAAAATAAHDVLAARFPEQAGTLLTTYNNYLNGLGLGGDPGVLAGQQAASCILSLRASDGSFPANSENFVGGTNPGEWRSTSFLQNGDPAPMVAVWLGTVTPFSFDDPAQFRVSQGPPDLTSGLYATDYNEVKALGALVNSTRTAEQTDMAYFFADSSNTYWNRALRTITDTYLTDIGDSARLFALVNVAMTDAIISSWNTKRFWNFWRPITAIREGDNDGNANTAADITWQPLITTPNYPDYTSGANNASGSVTTMLANFFGTDELTFSLTSTIAQAINKTRTYERFSAAADDVVEARILEGIHFRFADTVARTQGTDVANWAFARFLRPLAIPGLYQLVASHSQKCLDVPQWSLNDGMPVVQWACNGGDNQTWSLETASDGYSRLIAQHSGKCLDVSGVSTDDRADIIQWQCHSGENQQWRVEAVTGGYQLVARHSGKCLDVQGESTTDGGSIIQWSCNGGANQTWLLRPVSTVPPPLP